MEDTQKTLEEPLSSTYRMYYATFHPKYGFIESMQGGRDIPHRIQLMDEEEKEFDKTDDPYNTCLVNMSEGEYQNGFQLYPLSSDKPLMLQALYRQLLNLWNDKDQDQFNDFKTFADHCEDQMCSDWCKQDEHGNCFGGYWEFPEDSYERKHAFSLCQRKSIVELFVLPYPAKLIFETIEIGCSNRQESVRYTNLLCEWVCRKHDLLRSTDDEMPLLLHGRPFPKGFDERVYIYKGHIQPVARE